MSDERPERNNPLSPYYPSETPGLPGNGRKWFALLLAVLILGGAVYGVLGLFLPL